MAFVRVVTYVLSKWRQRRKEAPDVWKLYHYLHFYRQAVEKPALYGSEIGEAGRVIDFEQPAKNLPWRKHHVIVNTAVTEQLKEKLLWLQGTRDWGDPGGDVTLQDTLANGSSSASSCTSSALSQASSGPSSAPSSSSPSPSSCLSPAARDIAGYRLRLIEKSPNGHPIQGVWLEGFTPVGSVVAFFPGTVYFPEHLGEIPAESAADNPFLMARTDGSVIDAAEYDMEAVKLHPLALGHMVKHPPLATRGGTKSWHERSSTKSLSKRAGYFPLPKRGVEPNLMPFSYDVPSTFPADLLPLIPNRHYKPRQGIFGPTPRLQCLLLVTTRSIRDEELFLNYRLQPTSSIPDWYHSVDRTEEVRRWK